MSCLGQEDTTANNDTTVRENEDDEDCRERPTKRDILEMEQDEFVALVARTVNPAEISVQPKARAALDSEWTKLRTTQCWDEDHPMEHTRLR